jgi:hypothetical protein
MEPTNAFAERMVWSGVVIAISRSRALEEMMLYVQIFIVAFEKQIKIEPTAFLNRGAQMQINFQYGRAVKESCGIRKAACSCSPFCLTAISASVLTK